MQDTAGQKRARGPAIVQLEGIDAVLAAPMPPSSIGRHQHDLQVHPIRGVKLKLLRRNDRSEGLAKHNRP